MVSEQPPTRVSPPAVSVADARAAQNFPLAVAAGIGAAIVSAIAWAVLTVTTHMRMGLFSIGVGVLVGYAVRETGKGIDKRFGYLAMLCALLGCGIGDVLTDITYYATIRGMPLIEAATSLTPALMQRLMVIFFKPLDLIFYAIAIYQAYKMAFKFRPIPRKPVPTKAGE